MTNEERERRREKARRYRERHPEKVAARIKRYRERHPEKVAVVQKTYRDRHRDEIAARTTARYKENRDEMLERSKSWRHANCEKVSLYNKQYHAANRDKELSRARARRTQKREEYLTYSACRRAKRWQAEGILSVEDIKKQFASQEGLCFYCGKRLGDDWQIDHRTPFCRGGSNWPENVVCCCKKCNLRKGRRTAEEYPRNRD